MTTEFENKCCATAWLSAAIKSNRQFKNTEKNKTELVFESQDYEYIKSTAIAVKTTYNAEIDVDVTNVNTGLQKGKLYVMKVPPAITHDMLYDAGIIRKTKDGYDFVEGIDNKVVMNECCAKTYLKSLFVATGSANVPEKNLSAKTLISSRRETGIILNLRFRTKRMLYQSKKLLLSFDIVAKTVERGNKFIVYVKESEVISNFFALLGASETVLYMQDVMIERLVNNNVNRKSNCSVANMDKTAIASTKQLIAIENIEKKFGVKRLSEELRSLIALRKEYPEATLDFFAEKLGVSKSCINHRFRKK
ncbi:MAG: DNA-binding protein WhiA [Clostridiales bacterium]|nr:MAG: DNA-binding protein WhiA [Clostridiales bacterium]